MADILSQDEIDALLSSLSSGEMSESVQQSPVSAQSATHRGSTFANNRQKNISLYDFRRPDRVSKDQLRTLQNIHENYIRIFSTTLTTILRSLVEIELLSVDQLTYQEYIMSIPNPSVLYTFEMPPFDGISIFEMNLELVYIIVEKLFGGTGKLASINRELSSLEAGMIKKIVVKALDAYKQIWDHLINIKPKIIDYESNPQFVQIIPPSEIVILITFEVRLQNEMSGMMSMCLPYMVLEPVISTLTTQSWTNKKDPKENYNALIISQIKDRTIDLKVNLGEVKVKLRDLLQLKNGDIFKIDKKVGDSVDIYINNRKKMDGHIGMIKGRRAVEITKIRKKEN